MARRCLWEKRPDRGGGGSHTPPSNYCLHSLPVSSSPQVCQAFSARCWSLNNLRLTAGTQGKNSVIHMK